MNRLTRINRNQMGTRKLSTLAKLVSDDLDISTFRSILSDDLDRVEEVYTKINSDFAEAFKDLEPYLGEINVPLTTISLLLLEATSTGITVPLSKAEYELLQRILEDLIEEVERDMSRKEMTGGGTQRIIIRLLLIIVIAYALTMTLTNDFTERTGAYIKTLTTGGCNTELSLVYSLIVHMMEKLKNNAEEVKELFERIPVPQAAIDVSLKGIGAAKDFVERIPVPQAAIDVSLQALARAKGMVPLHLFPYSFKDMSSEDIYKLIGWGSQKMAAKIGLVKECSDNILIIREIVGNYLMVWRCYCYVALAFYGVFFDGKNRRNRSSFTEMLIQTIWRPYLGVGNPVIGAARSAVYALETLYDGVSGTCSLVDRVLFPQTALPQAQPVFAQAIPQAQSFESFGRAQPKQAQAFESFGKGGKLTKRKKTKYRNTRWKINSYLL